MLCGSGDLAVPGRLELPTFGLGNRCSIRLSYGTGVATIGQCIMPFEEHQKRHHAPESRPYLRPGWPAQGTVDTPW
jgi:hypothetical protein